MTLKKFRYFVQLTDGKEPLQWEIETDKNMIQLLNVLSSNLASKTWAVCECSTVINPMHVVAAQIKEVD